jgi:GNAT superfamily N-acetyltransferase
MLEVRRATRADRDAVLATVLAAFRDDPAWHFITGGDPERISPHFAAALFDGRVDKGTVWITPDAASVAMWAWKGDDAAPDPQAHIAWSAYRAAVGPETFAHLEAYDAALDLARPAPAYWYLGVLATHPARHGAGLASAVIRPVLELADRDRLDCWLETSTTGNRNFYERRGFTESIDVVVPDGPPTWWMRRPPRTDATP